MRKRIYFDMDGTLTKWEFVGPDVYTKRGYFQNRPGNTTVIEAARILIEKNQYEVCSASKFIYEHMIKEKNNWLDMMFGDMLPRENRFFIPYNESKSNIVTFQKAVLVDDYNPNLRDCEDAGGVAIKLLNGLNGGSSEWKGFTIDHRSDPETIAETIMAIAEWRLSA